MELKPTATDVRDLLGEVAAIHRAHAESKGLKLTEQHADDLPESLLCDPKRLRQILNNLINNAVKFTAQGSVSLLLERQGDVLRFSVSDTGIGIAPEQQEQIFERFHQAEHFMTREQGGTGLGLALAQELVTLMGGEIGLSSVPGAGSSFYFTLPVRLADD